MKENKTICCFVERNGRRCKRKAEYEIIYGNEASDVTESCASHIGELVDDKIARFEVVRI